MNHRRAIPAVLLCTAILLSTGLLAGAAAAQSEPGSLLIFPLFDNRPGVHTFVTVTNTNTDVVEGAVCVELVYARSVPVAGSAPGCEEFNATLCLTPADTHTVLTRAQLAGFEEEGYLFAFAKNLEGSAIAFDHLVGNVRIVDGIESREYALNPFVYRSPLAESDATDLDGDGLRDLDGVEYEQSPDVVLIPSFFGVGRLFSSDLILINLTGGTAFDATVNLRSFNDHEGQFSNQVAFRCWARIPLSRLTHAFTADFLRSTGHDPSEVVGATSVEAGWLEVNGGVAILNDVVIPDPALLAVLIERGPFGAYADLPFCRGRQAGGVLLPVTAGP